MISKQEENKLKKAQAKIELATFLHDTLAEMTLKQSITNKAKMAEFMKFAAEVRAGGRWVTNEDFKKYAPLFQDELTIDKMDRKTLDSLCRIFHVNLSKTIFVLFLFTKLSKTWNVRLSPPPSDAINSSPAFGAA